MRWISAKSLNALDEVDQMPRGLRECVHEFGLPIVSVLRRHGIEDPRHIREIVKEIWCGARQHGQRTGALNAVDFILSRGPVSSPTLMRLLADVSLAIVPMSPTRSMLNASMAEVSGHNVRCTREDKHRLRLTAAIRAASAESLALSKASPSGEEQ